MLDTKPSSGTASEAGNPRILIVDDVADNRDILARRFRKGGFEIAEAGGGVEALQKIEAEEFDLVLLDILMPDLDGYEVLKSVRNEPFLDDMRIIMVTAKTGSDDVVKALRLGANDFVTKPVDFAVVMARAEMQLARRRSIRALKATNRELVRRVAEAEEVRQRLEEQVSRLEVDSPQCGIPQEARAQS